MKIVQIWNPRMQYLNLEFLLFYNSINRLEGFFLFCLSHLGFIATHAQDFQELIIFSNSELRLKYSSFTGSIFPKQVSLICKCQRCVKKWKIQGKVVFSTIYLKYSGQIMLFSNSIGVNIGYVHRNCDFTSWIEKKSLFSLMLVSYIFGNDQDPVFLPKNRVPLLFSLETYVTSALRLSTPLFL